MTKSGFSILEAPQAASPISDQAAADQTPQLIPVVSNPQPGPWLQIRTVKRFEFNSVQLPIPGLPHELDGLRLLHLSDLHLRTVWDRAYDQLIDRVNANPPDLIVYTGDFVEHKHDSSRALPLLRRLLTQLKSRLGYVGILGNHDGDLLAPKLSALGITMLSNQRLCLGAGAATLELIGLVGVDRLDLNTHWLRSLGPKAPHSARIVLSHYPDQIRKCKFLQPDLFLAGHTHGGQICMPGRTPILRHDDLPRRHWSGIHRAYGTWLVVSRGMGFTALQMRLFCPAEVIEICLRGV